MGLLRRSLWLFGLLWLLSGCNQEGASGTVTVPVGETRVAAATPTPSLTPTPLPTPSAPPPPTATARPLVPAQATATPDPTLPDWTVLLYLPGDYAYAPSPLAQLNELSTALPGGRVQILAQIDSTPGNTPDGFDDARRYRLQPGSPELLNSLGEINMVEGEQLAAFLTWGVQTAPANRYALVIAAPGGGWAGVGLDETAPGDRLTLPELETALAQTRQSTGLDQFDLLLFTGSFMAQVDTFQALQPHAGVVVASAGLAPGFDMTRWLSLLATDLNPNAAALAQATIAQIELSQQPGASWVAVDMAQVPHLTHALEILADTLLHDPARYTPIASIARRNAEAYAWLSPQVADPIAAVDAWHFASLISQLSDDAGLVAAATNLMAAVRQSILAEVHGPAFLWARGIALTFPRNTEFLNPDYLTQTTIPAWAEWLRTYHQVLQRTALPPTLTLGQPDDTTINKQRPLFLGLEVAGIDLEQLTLVSGRYDRTGRQQLLEATPYVPRPASLNDGSFYSHWADGVNESLLVWPAELPYLSDGVRGDWVLGWPIGFTSVKAITGQVYPDGQEAGIAAQLLWDQVSGTNMGLWLVQAGIPYPLSQSDGLLFKPDNWYLEIQGQVTSQPGRELALSTLQVALNPLADGGYFVGLAAANSSGDVHQITRDVTVASSELFAGYQVHIDPGFGFQFLYPTGWQRPTLDGEVCQTEALTLCTFAPDQQTALHVVFYTEVGPRNATMLRDEAIAAFSGVDVLYEVEQTIAGEQAQYAVYGYTAPDGDHIGVLMTFVREGIGYVLDLDGPASQQVQTLDFADKLVRSWQFQPLLLESFAGDWQELVTPRFNLHYANGFEYLAQENGWHQFDAGQGSFMALRLDAAANRSADNVLRFWLSSAADRDNFQAVAPYRMLLGHYTWQRADFTWTADDGSPVSGFVMVTKVGDEVIVAWAEAPTVYYLHVERTYFRITLADLRLSGAAPPQ